MFPRLYREVEEMIEHKVLETWLARAICRKGMPRLRSGVAGAVGGFRGRMLKDSSGNYPPIVLSNPSNAWYWIPFEMIIENHNLWYDGTYWTPPEGNYWLRVAKTLTFSNTVPRNDIQVYIAGLDSEGRTSIVATATPHFIAEGSGTSEGMILYRYETSEFFTSSPGMVFTGSGMPVSWGVYVRLASHVMEQVTIETYEGGSPAYESIFQGTYLGPLPS